MRDLDGVHPILHGAFVVPDLLVSRANSPALLCSRSGTSLPQVTACSDSMIRLVFSMQINGQGLSSIKANGKKMSKRDGVWTKKDTIICTITAAGADDRQPVAFECPAVIEGKVLQVNTNLQTHPGPFIDRPYDDGYLLVSCLFPEQRKKMLEQWPSAEEFCLTRSLHQDDVRGGYVVRK